MKKFILNKIKNERGASIIFALMILLICTMIASMLVVAATVTGGSYQQTEDMDQRYYSVMSAANLVKNELNGQKLILKREKASVTETTITLTQDASGTDIENRQENAKAENFKFYNCSPADVNFILKDAAFCLIYGDDNGELTKLKIDEYYTGNEAKEFWENEIPAFNKSHTVKRDLNMTHTSAMSQMTGKTDNLRIDISTELMPDGTLYLTFQNHVENASDDKYRVVLKLDADIKETTNISSSTEREEPEILTNGIKTVENTTTKNIKTTTIQWNAEYLRKV